MRGFGTAPGEACPASPLRLAFLKWQCRVRQDAMRYDCGRPGEGMIAALFLPRQEACFGRIVMLLNRAPDYPVTPELDHMTAMIDDPARRREQAVRFLSATYYRNASEFSGILTATFPPGSPGAAKVCDAGRVRLVFDSRAHVFDLTCKVRRRRPHDPLHRATLAHNRLFNPALPPGTQVLGFDPDWRNSTSGPAISDMSVPTPRVGRRSGNC